MMRSKSPPRSRRSLETGGFLAASDGDVDDEVSDGPAGAAKGLLEASNFTETASRVEARGLFEAGGALPAQCFPGA